MPSQQIRDRLRLEDPDSMDPDEQHIGEAAPQWPSIADGHEAALVPVDAEATVTEQQMQPTQEIEESGTL